MIEMNENEGFYEVKGHRLEASNDRLDRAYFGFNEELLRTNFIQEKLFKVVIGILQ